MTLLAQANTLAVSAYVNLLNGLQSINGFLAARSNKGGEGKTYNTGGNWDLTAFLDNSTGQLETWGNMFLVLLGVVGVVIAGYQIISGLMSDGKKQVSYGKQAILLLFSGAMMVSGFILLSDIAGGGAETIKSLGGQN